MAGITLVHAEDDDESVTVAFDTVSHCADTYVTDNEPIAIANALNATQRTKKNKNKKNNRRNAVTQEPAVESQPKPKTTAAPCQSPQNCTPVINVEDNSIAANTILEGNVNECENTPVAAIRKVGFGDFALVSTLGTGSYGKVWKVQHKSTGRFFALKSQRKSKLIKENLVEMVKMERDLLASIQCAYIIPVLATFNTPSHIFSVMPLCKGGELRQHIHIKGKLPLARVKFYAIEIAIALSHIHYCKFVYRDLKSNNVMLNEDGHVCLVDFGLAAPLKQSKDGEWRTSGFGGTLEYICPEMLLDQPYGVDADWWSYGILLYEMVTGDFPWQSENDVQLSDMICEAKLNIPSNIDSRLADLIKKLLDPIPTNRLRTYEQVVSHPFFAGTDWHAAASCAMVPPFKPDIAKDDRKYFNESAKKLRPLVSTCKAVSNDQNAKFSCFNYVSPVFSKP